MILFSPQTQILLIGIVVSLSCTLVGCFLLLRNMSMMTDAISHTILLGIVIGFFLTKDLSSPVLIISAGLIGVLTVYLVEAMHSTKLVSEDSAIGIVFPLLFSIAIIIISKYARNTHLDVSCVMLGDITFAPYKKLIIGNLDLGARAIYSSGAVLVINLAFLILFFKELKVSTFDPALAFVLGMMPSLIHYLLMTLVSVTIVASFEAVGSILVIAFMIGSPATAYLLTENLKKMIGFSSIIGILNSFLGYEIAAYFDVSIPGSIALMTGITFLFVFLFSPKNGLVFQWMTHRKNKQTFTKDTFLLHLYNHHGVTEEISAETIGNHLCWSSEQVNDISSSLLGNGFVTMKEDCFVITSKGEERLRKNYAFILEE